MTRRAGWLALVFLLLAGSLGAQRRDDGPHAVVAGTVFHENGLSFPGVAVTLVAQDPGKGKPRKMEALSNARGEFAFRVPPGPAVYRVRATMKPFSPVEKEAQVSGEERVEVTLVLEAESKSQEKR
jgi:hypothetical protein